MREFRTSISAIAVALSLVGTSAVAQTAAPAAAPAPAADPTGGHTVDEIIVTAQKRSNSLQNVPIVVTAVGHQLLEDTGVKDIKDLAVLTPGLLVTSTTNEGSTTARIRGIGTVGDNAGLESSVGVVIDGVYRPRNGVGFGDLGDVSQIEVLKGPQGTLFGKSATAGVINIMTAPPSFKFGVDADFTAGNYGAYGGAIQVTGPIVKDTVAASLYFADRQRNGYYTVNDGPGPNTATRDSNRDFWTIRGQILIEPTTDFKVRLIADHTHRSEECCIAVITRASEFNLGNGIVSALGGNDGNPANPYARTAYANRPDGQKVDESGISMQVDWKVGPGTLTSVTAYRDWKNTAGFDADFSTADLIYLPYNNSNSTEFKTFSQELRYAGSTKNLDYLVGGFFSNEILQQNTSILVGSQFNEYLALLFSSLVPPNVPNPTFLQTGLTFPLVGGVNYVPGSGSVDQFHQRDKTYALFTDDTFHFTDKLSLNAGLRWTYDDKKLAQVSNNIGGGAGCGEANTAFAYLNAGAPATAQALAAVNGTMCLPFLSPGYNNYFNNQAESESVFSGTAKLVYRANRELLLYASYARGYKAGGFNLDRVECTIGTAGCAPGSAAAITPINNTSFGDETNDSFEVGEKATLFNRKLLLNASLFYQKYKGFQLNTFNGLVFVVASVPEVISKGVDADFMWIANNQFTIQGGVTYADTRYHLNGAQLATLAAETGFQGTTNSRMSLAPFWSASLSGTYTQPIGDSYQARFNLGAKYSSGYNTGSDLDPGKYQGGYVLMNGRIAFGPKDQHWAIEAWAENLLNTNYQQIAFNSSFQNVPTNATGVLDAFLGAPRTFGGTLRVKF